MILHVNVRTDRRQFSRESQDLTSRASCHATQSSHGI